MRALRADFGRAARADVDSIREACDALVLARSVSPRDRHAMTESVVLLADLVERGAVSSWVAAAMADDIGRCAPGAS
jgi:hypothetical protein